MDSEEFKRLKINFTKDWMAQSIADESTTIEMNKCRYCRKVLTEETYSGYR
jgi:hypothetical protein